MPVILMRHPAPAIDSGFCYGITDIPLADAPDPAHYSHLPRFDRLVSSPLARCRLVAEVIAAARGIPAEIDARLKEMDFGRWEGQRWDDIPREEIDAWDRDFFHARPHGGESVAMLAARVDAALETCNGSGVKGVVLIVTHAGVIRAAFRDWRASVAYGALRVLDDSSVNLAPRSAIR